jgi:glyoxylase-like metal-dependent hydrolase (beta-lactamase superfamily II)
VTRHVARIVHRRSRPVSRPNDAMSPALRYKTFVSGQVPHVGRGPLPDGSPRMWSPITSTLIMGKHDAVLVDPPATLAQAAAVGDWIDASGRTVRQIYITHGRGGHWFGAMPLLHRFPDASVLATSGTKDLMAAQNQPGFRNLFWDTVFPGHLPTGEVAVSVVDVGFELEGVPLLPVEVGRTDTGVTTILHIPDIGLIVAGDVVYNGVHPYLIESGAMGGIDAWLTALDIAEGLRAATVIAGHKDPRAFDTPSEIQSTRRYLSDARRLQADCTSAEQFYKGMLALHPHRLNPGVLWDAAMTLFPPARRPRSGADLTHGDSSFIR